MGGTFELVLGVGAVAVIAGYFLIPSFKQQVEAALGGGGGSTVGPNVIESGSSGNCSWDSKGGWCWKSSACNAPCRGCVNNVKTSNITDGCAKARAYFLAHSKICPGCTKLPAGGGIGGSTCPYVGCSHIHADPTSCATCRCQNVCRSYPGTVINVGADGSCHCVKRGAQAYAYDTDVLNPTEDRISML